MQKHVESKEMAKRRRLLQQILQEGRGPNNKMKLLDFIRAVIDDWVGELDLQIQQERVDLLRNNVQDGDDEDDHEKEAEKSPKRGITIATGGKLIEMFAMTMGAIFH
jgi:hypothetical protein